MKKGLELKVKGIKGFFNIFVSLFNKIKKSDFYKSYKEELVVVPILVIAFYYINHYLISEFPNSAFFDFFSQIETLMFKGISFAIAIWISHLGLRIAFPKVYKYLHNNFYDKFENIEDDKKVEYSVKFILVFIIAAALIFGGL